MASVLFPLLVVGMTIPESFAGERERHTLETLLASRLPDRAILFGKMAVPIGLAWAMVLLVLLISLVTANATSWSGHLRFYRPGILLGSVALSLLIATLSASAGVLISLRAATVQQAQQILTLVTMVPFLLLGMLVPLLLNMKLGWVERIKQAIATGGSTLIILIIAVVLIAACLGLLWAAMARFRRGRLIIS